jgi:hypothetical protein
MQDAMRKYYDKKMYKIPTGQGLSVEALVHYGDELLATNAESEKEEQLEQAGPLDVSDLLKEIARYHQRQPSLEPTIDLSLLLKLSDETFR